ncbi:MAG TPA: ThuA domain-containing protein [Ruminiclostridium sp.]
MEKKIFLILGDYYHAHDLAYQAIVKASAMATEGTSQSVELIDSSIENLEEALNQNVDLVVLYKENRVNPTDEVVYNWMTPKIEAKILEYVNRGGSWLAWHNGMASYPETGEYSNMLRGYFLHHPSENKNVKYFAKENDVGISLEKSFEAMDEHYFVQCNAQKDSVFLSSESVDGKCEAGWAHEFGTGRVCCLTPTHREEGMTNEGMLQILSDCVKWCCKI